MTFDEAKMILAALEAEGVRYVLVGSMGMAAQGLVRATRVLDLFVAPDEDNVRRLRSALNSLFNDRAWMRLRPLTWRETTRPSNTFPRTAAIPWTFSRGSAKRSDSRTSSQKSCSWMIFEFAWQRKIFSLARR